MLSTIIGFLTSKAGGYVSIILAILGTWFIGQRSGKKKAEQKAMVTAATEVARVIEKAMGDREKVRAKFDKIRDDIRSKHPDELHQDKTSGEPNP